MIDLHIHSRLSIGEYSSSELLEMIEEKDLEVFSITDNEHCLAYSDFNMSDYPNLITGSIFTTSIDGLIINIIGYEVNPIIVNDFYFEKYGKVNIEKQEYKFFDKLVQIMTDNSIKLSDNLQLSLVEKGVSKKLVYYDAIKNNPDFEFGSYTDFYRNGLSNPYSPFFLDEAGIHPSLDEILNLVKKAGGLAFLAHPYEYAVKVETLVDKLVDRGIDGLEVFHPSAALRQSLKLISLCNKYNLHASGGSDFRKSRYLIPIGVNVHPQLYKRDCFKWLNKYKQID